MAWRTRREEQEAVEGMIHLLVAGLIICATVAACSFTRMEQAVKPLTLKEQTAMIQARWEANARSRAEVRP